MPPYAEAHHYAHHKYRPNASPPQTHRILLPSTALSGLGTAPNPSPTRNVNEEIVTIAPATTSMWHDIMHDIMPKGRCSDPFCCWARNLIPQLLLSKFLEFKLYD
jgi:hypothetical protein